MALIALGLGALGIVDLAGVAVAPSAYPALALGTTAAMLLVGAFYGRGGGLILAGLLLAAATASTAAAERIDFDDIEQRPLTAAGLAPRYDYGVGEVRLDLRDVSDLESLDGRTVSIDLDAGEIRVLVPEGLDVRVEATIDRFGTTRLFDDTRESSNVVTYDGGEDVPAITIEARVRVGEIDVRTPGRFSR